MSCTNNLKQIGIALHNYHDTHRTLPMGWLAFGTGGSYDFEGGPGWAWSTRILPFLEQRPLYESVDMNVPVTAAANDAVRIAVVSSFICPSDVGDDVFNLKNGIDEETEGTTVITRLAKSNYPGVFGTQDIHAVCETGESGFNGCQGNGMFYLNRCVAFRDITDGLSNTFMVGERWSKWIQSTWTGVVPSGWHAHSRVVAVASDEMPPNSEANVEQQTHNFSSFHPAGANFLLSDGHVQLITETIDVDVYTALCTRAGSEMIGEF